MSLAHRRRCVAAQSAAVILLASACALMPGNEPVGEPSMAPTTAGAAGAADGSPVLTQGSGSAHGLGELAGKSSPESGDAERIEPAELEEAVSVEPTGLQRRLGRWDLPGPFLRFGSVVPGRDYAVSDRCERPELSSAWEAAGGWGALMPEFGMTAWTRRLVESELVRCTSQRFEVVAGARDGGPLFFGEREAANGWVERQHVNVAREYSVARSQTLRDGSSVMGIVDSDSRGHGGPLGIVFAPVHAPVDEVRVLPWSVHVHDDALRGLVRNWSRDLWAYEVTVAAGDHVFSWPLSIQPGEAAPFEIGGWDAAADPESISFHIQADMSAHVDPSRAFYYESAYASYGNLPQYRVEVSGEGWDRYGDVWAEAEAGAVSVGSYDWSPALVVPDSHPSLADDIAALDVSDLRAYGAVLDGTGRVMQVGPASIRSLVPAPDGGRADDEELEWVEIEALRGGEPRSSSLDVTFWVFEELPEVPPDGPHDQAVLALWFHDYNPDTDQYLRNVGHYGGFIVWIGAAHPARTSE